MRGTFLPFALTVCGIEELAGLNAAGVTHVLSILDPNIAVPVAFDSFGKHERLELRFHDIIEPVAGEVAPSRQDVARILSFGADRLSSGEVGHLLVHCHMGISRSVAAMTMLMVQARPDLPAADAMAAVVAMREKAWPNLRMIEFADDLLGRRGELVAAAKARYLDYAASRPALVRYLIDSNRVREVEDLID